MDETPNKFLDDLVADLNQKPAAKSVLNQIAAQLTPRAVLGLDCLFALILVCFASYLLSFGFNFEISGVVTILVLTSLCVLIMLLFLTAESVSYLNAITAIVAFWTTAIGLISGTASAPVQSGQVITAFFLWIILRFGVLKPIVEYVSLQKLYAQSKLFDHLETNFRGYKFQAGSTAPDFKTMDRQGKPVHLKQMLDNGKKVWLILYRYATCPLCLNHLREAAKKFAALKSANAEVIIVFESPSENFKRFSTWFSKLDAHFISDPDREIYSLYRSKVNLLGAFTPRVAWALIKATLHGFFQGKVTGRLGRLPAHFLIDSSGRITRAFYGDSISDQLRLEEVDHFIQTEK